MHVQLGIEELFAGIRKRRVGVLAHAASILEDGTHLLLAMKREDIVISRIFSPEHGLWGAAQDMEGVDHCHDAIVDQDIVSLYGHRLESLAPDDKLLDDLDCVVIDVQDVGARYYTFAYTALFLAQAALKRHIDVYVVDRPNPINCVDLEGNLVDNAYRSFVGMRSSMTRHGMTIGEMLTMWCTTEHTPNPDCLHICWMKHYERTMYFDETSLIWAMPSPNMPTLDTAIVYPGMCLLEGTNMSEGRGTTRPFEIFGAPWVNVPAAMQALKLLDLPGVVFRPLDFKPMFQKHVGALCHGFQMHVTDRTSFKPLLTGIAIVGVMYALHPEFAWRTETYEFVSDRLAIDLLFGNDRVRHAIETQANPRHIIEEMTKESATWRAQREAFLHY